MRLALGVARSRPDELERLVDPARRARRSRARQAEADVLGDRQVREERAFLRDVADGALVRRRRGRAPPSATIFARRSRRCRASAATNPMSTRSSVVLPLPDAPRIAVSVPSGDVEVDVARHRRLAVRLRDARQRSSAIVTSAPNADPAEPAHERGTPRPAQDDSTAANGAAAANATVELLASNSVPSV